MPQQTVYIRNDDMPLWKSVKNKAQFIADALHSAEDIFTGCCSRYPDRNCGHWIKESETDQLINQRTGEVVDL